MKIAIVCPNHPPATFEGGISHYSASLADSLRSRGHSVVAVASTEFARAKTHGSESPDIETIRIPGPWNHCTVAKIRATAAERQLDAVILQYAPALFTTGFRLKWAVSRFPCQKITAFHTLWGSGLDRLVGLSVLFGSPKIVATNSEIMAIMKRRLPFLLGKTRWIPIASSIVPCGSHPMAGDFKAPIVCYFGMMYPGKGLYLILDVIAELARRQHRFEFKFIGGEIVYEKTFNVQFRRRLEGRAIDANLEMLGRLPAEDVSAWMSRSRFVFLPYEKGVSDRRSSLMSALAHGKAVLTSPPVVSLPLFRSGFNMLWPIEPSVQAYVELFERMLWDDHLIARLEAGARQLSQHFSWDRIGAEYEKALRPNASGPLERV